MRKMSTVARWHALPIILAAVLVVFAPGATAAPRLTLTAHVPPAVANGQALRLAELAPTQRIDLAISLPLRNEAALDDLLGQLYAPASPRYHQYLSVSEFAEWFGATSDDHEAVVHFAGSNGLVVTGTRASRLVVDVEGPVANIEQALHVAMGIYRHPTENRTFYAPDREPTLDLDVPVLHISGLDDFTLPRPKNIISSPESKGTGSGPGGQFIGSDMRAAYYGSGPLAGAGQSVGLFEFGGYELSDVQLYFQKLNQPLHVPVTGISLNGASLGCPPSSCYDDEQALDIEMTIAMAPGLSEVLVYVGKRDVSIFSQMAADNIAKQLSCSWGWSRNETTLDPIFKEFAAQGQSVFVATGDGGSRTPGNSVWPADDRYVTAVGGTDLTTNGPGGSWKSEQGWRGSAGGPSKNNIPIPAYQQRPGVINPSNQGSTTLRNIPDVAAEANTNQYSCYNGFCSGGNGGTSYAAPQWAAFTALMNERALADGGTTLGSLNPAIYRISVETDYQSDFHDITRGSNGKYTAVQGYDLVTGWGSFDGPNLVKALTGSH